MKVQHLIAIAFAFLAGVSAQAHDVVSGEKIKVACTSDDVHMGAIARAVKKSHLWASQGARRQMLALARRACGGGASVVTFVPADDQRSCKTPPTWSTLCADPTANPGEAPDL